MEDAVVFHRISKEVFLFAVFDGHGGLEVSKYCAKHLPEVIEQSKAFQRGDYERALEEAFFELDRMMTTPEGEETLRSITVEHGMQPFDNENSKVSNSVGCTANVALLVGKKLYVANAGDSRAALSRAGSIIELSYDHKP
jgi:serine/threonine protein phosphatase PrpC